MNSNAKYIGMDVHKESISIAVREIYLDHMLEIQFPLKIHLKQR